MTNVSLESEVRLRHSSKGLSRLAQMESAEIHIYVEGQVGDRFYFARVLSKTIRDNNLKIQFHLANEIEGAGVGKQRCLAFHDFLERNDRLVSRLEGKCTIHCFLLDKDIDDLLGILRNSRHIMYTSFYCVENHIVTESDLAESLAAAIGMDVDSVKKELPDQNAWLNECYELWKEWVAICIFANITKSGVANYKRHSQVNIPPNAPADDNLVKQHIKNIGSRLALDSVGCTQSYSDALAIVEEHATNGQQGKLFKGKWFARLLAQIGTQLAGSIDEKMLWAALCSNVRAEHPQSNIYREYLLTVSRLCV